MLSHPWFLAWLIGIPATFVLDAVYHRLSRQELTQREAFLHCVQCAVWPCTLLVLLAYGAVHCLLHVILWAWYSLATPRRPRR